VDCEGEVSSGRDRRRKEGGKGRDGGGKKRDRRRAEGWVG